MFLKLKKMYTSILICKNLEQQIITSFSPSLNPPAETQPDHRHTAEHAAQVEGPRVPLQSRRHAGS